MFARTQILVDLPKISSKVSFIIASRSGILEKYFPKTLREKKMKMGEIERERVENQVA